MKTHTLLFFSAFVLFTSITKAQSTFNDLTFGNGGLVTTDVSGNNDEATSIAVQPDGKIVTAGYAIIQSHREMAVCRYNTDGSADQSFGTAGCTTVRAGAANSTASS